MELTWIAIVAGLLMGASALLIFIWGVRYQQFRNFEDVKYQVFWSDLADRENAEAQAELARRAELADLTLASPAKMSEERLDPPPSRPH